MDEQDVGPSRKTELDRRIRRDGRYLLSRALPQFHLGGTCFWRSDDAQSLADMAALKTAQAAWGKDQRFVLIGLNLDGTLAAARKYATDNKLTWVQCYLGEHSDVPMRYRLRGVASTTTWMSGPQSMLIGPDGRMVRSDLRGTGIATALEEVLDTK